MTQPTGPNGVVLRTLALASAIGMVMGIVEALLDFPVWMDATGWIYGSVGWFVAFELVLRRLTK